MVDTIVEIEVTGTDRQAESRCMRDLAAEVELPGNAVGMRRRWGIDMAARMMDGEVDENRDSRSCLDAAEAWVSACHHNR